MNSLLRLRLIKKGVVHPAKAGTWPMLSEPINPQDTADMMRAQSLLCGMQFRDGSTQCDALTPRKAADVIAWATSPAPAPPLPAKPRWRRFFFR